MVSRQRIIAYGLILITVSIIASFGMAEIFIRLVVLHHLNVAEKRFREPSFYGDYFSDDDYWKLRYKIGDIYKPPEHPHPLLGWVGDFDRENYRHIGDERIAGRTPVLLYGDSFAECETEICFQDLLNGDKDFSKQYYLLNYGVVYEKKIRRITQK